MSVLTIKPIHLKSANAGLVKKGTTDNNPMQKCLDLRRCNNMPTDAAYEAMRDENDALRLELYRMRKKLLECELQRDYLQRELDALRESNRNWISTNERLPPEDGKYIVAYKANRGGWKVKSVYYRGGKWISVAHDVTHWQECPAPPEEV